MREKKQRLVVTFPTTAAAMEMEAKCRQAGIEGKLIPVPRSLTADCGIAWRCEPETREAVEAILKESRLEAEGIYSVLL